MAYDKLITLQTPTRNRVSSLIRTLQSIENTVEDKSCVELMLFVHDDDTTTLDWLSAPTFWPTYDVVPLVAPAETKGYYRGSLWYSLMSKQARGQWNMWVADDIVFDTPMWDRLLLPFDGKFGVIHPHCDEDRRFSVQPIYSKSLFNVMGWLGSHPYIDRWMGALVERFPELSLGEIPMQTRHIQDNVPTQEAEKGPSIDAHLDSLQQREWDDIFERVNQALHGG